MMNSDFRLHILSIRALTEADLRENAGTTAVINCAESPNDALSLCHPSRLLTLSFADKEDASAADCFSAEQASAIVGFFKNLSDGLSDLFVCCDAGESRSPAIAAAVLLMVGKSDAPIWENPFYHPNLLVFGRLCEAFGLKLTEEQIARKKRQSEEAFRNAMKYGARHSRWEVIDGGIS